MKLPLIALCFAVSLVGGMLPSAYAGGRGDAKVAVAPKVPRDFKLVAQFGPGESDWKWWTTTILANGKATQTVRDQQTAVKKLSRAQFAQLVWAVRSEHLSGLSKEYPTAVKDGPTLILTLSENGRSHQVTVFLPSRKRDDPHMKRFLKIWSLVLTFVPSPNPEQTPDAYR